MRHRPAVPASGGPGRPFLLLVWTAVLSALLSIAQELPSFPNQPARAVIQSCRG
ncbi:unnamed protein product [Amoebophrya sp. A25]|nr:unnamed protein product [Amoebophrya sp. A25]|eukprot:GSA25T00012377001.1